MMLGLPPPDPGVEIVASSHGMSKGIAQTNGPQIVTKGSLRFGAIQFGLQWKNVSSPSANGEGWLFVSAAPKLRSLQLNFSIARKFQTRVRGQTDSKSWEFSAGAIRKFGSLSFRVNAIYSPDDLGPARRSLFVEGGPAVQFGKGWTASTALGHRSRQDAPDYTAFNAGVGTAIGRLQLDLRYHDTNRSRISNAFSRRIVASARLSF
jgi:hypothetical protein